MNAQQTRLIELGDKLQKLYPPDEQIRRYKAENPESKGHPMAVHYGGWARIIASGNNRQLIADAINLAAKTIGELESEAVQS